MPRPVIKNWRLHGCGRRYEQEMVIEISDQRDGERREDSAEERGGRVLYWREWLERGARWGLLDSKLQRENHEKTPINPWKNQHIDTIWRQETSLGDKKTFIVIRSHHYVVFLCVGGGVGKHENKLRWCTTVRYDYGHPKMSALPYLS